MRLIRLTSRAPLHLRRGLCHARAKTDNTESFWIGRLTEMHKRWEKFVPPMSCHTSRFRNVGNDFCIRYFLIRLKREVIYENSKACTQTIHRSNSALQNIHRSLAKQGRKNLVAAGVVLFFGLVSCGGSGSGKDPQPVTPDPPPVITDPPPVITDPQPVIPDPPPVITDPQPVITDPQPVTPDPPPVITDPPPVIPDPPPEPACLETADFGCIDPTEYQQRLRSLVQAFRSEAGFSNQWGLGAIQADVAYADIALRYGSDVAPGDGQIIGVIDSGIDRSHPVFAGKTVFEQFYNGAVDETGTLGWSHGTAVASVIAGNPSDSYISNARAGRGIAHGADIVMFALPVGSGGRTYRPISLAGLNSVDESSAAIFNSVTGWSHSDRSLDFVNMSLGYSGLIEQYSASDLRLKFGKTVSALAQADRTEKTIFVISAGNANGSQCNAADFVDDPHLCTRTNQSIGSETRVNARSPNILAGLPALLPELRGQVIAVAAVAPDVDSDGDYEIASFSNRCGIAAEWCISAPGVSVRVAYFGPDTNNDSIQVRGVRGMADSSGTSFAAPMVTGSLAVMKHAFRNQLSNTALALRLLDTANNRGLYSDTSVYGRGLLDLGAALSPVGETNVVLGSNVGSSTIALAETVLHSGRALGDGIAHGLSGQEFAVFDGLGAPFWLMLADRVGSASPPLPGAYLNTFMTPDFQPPTTVFLQPDFTMLRKENSTSGDSWHLGLMQGSKIVSGGGYLSLADQALSFSLHRASLRAAAFSTEGMHRQAPTSGTTLSWQPLKQPFEFRGGLIVEQQSMLGSQLAGAFGNISARSMFVGVNWRRQFESWNLHAEVEIGKSYGSARDGMIKNISPLVSSAFALHAHRPLWEGTFSFSTSQPLRIETGKAQMSVPIGRTQQGQVLHRSLSVGLTPTSRQVDTVAQWARSFGNDGTLRLGAIRSHHPGHDASVDADFTILASLSTRF